MKLALLLACAAQLIPVTSKPQHYKAIQFRLDYVAIQTTTVCVSNGPDQPHQWPDGSCMPGTQEIIQTVQPTAKNRLPTEIIQSMVIFDGPEHLGAWDDTRHGYVGIYDGDWIIYLAPNWVQILSDRDFKVLYTY